VAKIAFAITKRAPCFSIHVLVSMNSLLFVICWIVNRRDGAGCVYAYNGLQSTIAKFISALTSQTLVCYYTRNFYSASLVTHNEIFDSLTHSSSVIRDISRNKKKNIFRAVLNLSSICIKRVLKFSLKFATEIFNKFYKTNVNMTNNKFAVLTTHCYLVDRIRCILWFALWIYFWLLN